MAVGPWDVRPFKTQIAEVVERRVSRRYPRTVLPLMTSMRTDE